MVVESFLGVILRSNCRIYL